MLTRSDVIQGLLLGIIGGSLYLFGYLIALKSHNLTQLPWVVIFAPVVISYVASGLLGRRVGSAETGAGR